MPCITISPQDKNQKLCMPEDHHVTGITSDFRETNKVKALCDQKIFFRELNEMRYELFNPYPSQTHKVSPLGVKFLYFVGAILILNPFLLDVKKSAPVS